LTSLKFDQQLKYQVDSIALTTILNLIHDNDEKNIAAIQETTNSYTSELNIHLKINRSLNKEDD